MTLRAGDRLGPYEILTPLGSGGMGEVYKARDTRLSRDVALKTLIVEAGRDAERFRRFKKEAESTAALSHPNIVAIFDIGEERDIPYIVSELVPGGTLRDLLDRGPLPIRKLLELAAGIAEGLAAAHAAGIIHRDLKPDNVLLTSDGRPKIADFGLAKYFRAGSDPEGSQLATMTDDRTKEGTILGTVGYMSPEQASGRPLDFRSDQFSFGSILYEMATGKRPFARGTPAQTLAAIIEDEPEPLATVNPRTPVSLRWIVERCLAKEFKDRYDSTLDLARDLARLRDRLSEASFSGAVSAAKPSRFAHPVPAAVFALAAVAALLAGVFAGKEMWKAKPPPPPRFQQVTFRKVALSSAVLAPDGQTIIYSAYAGKGLELFETQPGSRGSRSLGIHGARIESMSASGQMALIRESDNVLEVAPLGGGEPRPLAQNVTSADWASDGKSLAIVRQANGPAGPQIANFLQTRVEFPVGNVLCQPCGGRVRVSPRGDRVLLRERGRLTVMDRKKTRIALARDAADYTWSPDGEEVWFTRITNGATNLFAADLAGHERTLASLPGNFWLHAVSPRGGVLLSRGFAQWQLVGRFPGDEREHAYNWFDATVAGGLSADGKILLFTEVEPGWRNGMSYIRKTDGSPAVPFAEGFCGSLSPDARWAICQSELPSPNLEVVSTSGETRELKNGGLEFKKVPATDWLPDGKHIVFTANAPGRPSRIYVQSIDGSPPSPVTPEGVEMVGPYLSTVSLADLQPMVGRSVSPDGRFIVGIRENLAALYPLSGGSALPIAGILPADLPFQWDPAGRSLYLERGDAPGKVWLLDLASGRRRLFKEFPLFEPWMGARVALAGFYLTPDGRYYAAGYEGSLADLFVLDGVK